MADWNIFQPTDASKPIHQILSGIQRGGFYVTNDNDEDKSRQALLDALAAAGYPAPSSTDPVYVHRTDTGNLERNTGDGWAIVDQWQRPIGTPYVEAVGDVAIQISNDNSGFADFDFPSGRFDVPPSLTAGIMSNTAQYTIAGCQARSETEGRIYIRRIDGTSQTATLNVRWHAVQMTPTSAAG